MFEPPEVNAAQCHICGKHVIEFEIDELGLAICWDCIGQMMEEKDDTQKTG